MGAKKNQHQCSVATPTTLLDSSEVLPLCQHNSSMVKATAYMLKLSWAAVLQERCSRKKAQSVNQRSHETKKAT